MAQGTRLSYSHGDRTEEPPSRLGLSNASAAIFQLDDGRYLLQLRDDIETIWYPAHWGAFGGAVEDGEDPEMALRRELKEEIDFEPVELTYFTTFTFDFSFVGCGKYDRTFFVGTMSSSQVSDLVLREGLDMRAFTAVEVFGLEKVVPYDAFAIHLHINKKRIEHDIRQNV